MHGTIHRYRFQLFTNPIPKFPRNIPHTPREANRPHYYPIPLARKGSIAEREHTKWENVPDVPGNPYSPAELQKRLSTQSLHREADLIRLSNVDHDDVSTAGTPDRLPTPVASPVSKPDISRLVLTTVWENNSKCEHFFFQIWP